MHLRRGPGTGIVGVQLSKSDNFILSGMEDHSMLRLPSGPAVLTGSMGSQAVLRRADQDATQENKVKRARRGGGGYYSRASISAMTKF